MGTIVAGMIVVGLVALAVRSMIKDKKMENHFTVAEIVNIVVGTAIREK